MYNWFEIETEVEYRRFEQDRAVAAKAALAQSESGRPRRPRLAWVATVARALRPVAVPWPTLANRIDLRHGAACECAPGD
jgi:hypothetical protein